MHEGPIARAYLSRMRQAKLQPGAIILLVYSHNSRGKNLVGRYLPRIVRPWYAEKHQEVSQNYWPRRLKHDYPLLFDTIAKSLGPITENPDSLLKQMQGKFNYADFTEGEVTKVYIRTLKDPILLDRIKHSIHPTFIYTGGGIVPSEVLSLPGIRFIHTHPGHLPHVRGADGLLWSTLVRGRPGASCFFLDEGIDTGPIIAAEDYPAITFQIPGGMLRPDDKTLYRAVFSYYDPILRAEALIKTLNQSIDLPKLPGKNQDHSLGVTYHFMHPLVYGEALSRLFISE